MIDKQQQYFNRGQKLFWLLLVLVCILSILHLADRLYDGKDIPKYILALEYLQDEKPIIEKDSLNKDNNDSIDKNNDLHLTWKWKDFNNETQTVTFSYKSNYLNLSKQNRSKYDYYEPLYSHDKVLLSSFIEKMSDEIKKKKLNYMEVIEYVCSSIQDIPYTLVLPSNSEGCPCTLDFGSFSSNCKVQSNGRGCCEGVDPFGVYAPFEFVYKKTGDCDTRALLAFTILKEMGFDVAVMVSRSESHSVLGIYMPNSNTFSTGENNIGKKYVLWELTSPDWRLGMNVGGYDWITALE
jgi:hypothetical protein